jgi:hypothetical protein
MKTLHIAALGFAALLVPAAALAQNAPPAPPSAAEMQSHMAQFEQLHQKMEQMHTQARTQMLESLSAAHKAAIANIIGQLAIAPNPNPEAAARQIDGLLSPGERQSVLRIHDTLRSESRSLMESVRSQMPHPSMQGGPSHPFGDKGPNGQNRPPIDAGHILLMLANPGMHNMMFHHP